jgi:hypothetical protein
MLKNEENKKTKESQDFTPDGVRLWMLTPSLEDESGGIIHVTRQKVLHRKSDGVTC